MGCSAPWRHAVAVVLLTAGCAHLDAPPEPATAPSTLGALDAAYDRSKWRWVKNKDGRTLLAHTELTCFIDPQPPLDFAPDLRVTREKKAIGNVTYDVVTAFEGQQFWEAVYVRSGSTAPLLGVYASGKCQQEAERILEAYEKRR